MEITKASSDLSAPSLLIQTLQQRIERQKEEIAKYKSSYENLLLAYERLRRQIFGKKSEKLSPEQQTFAWACAVKEVEGTVDSIPPPPPSPSSKPEKKETKKATPHGRRKLADLDLPEETIVLEPAVIPENATRVGEDVSFRIEHQRARAIKLKIVRLFYRLPESSETLRTPFLQEGAPHEMIPRGIFGHGMLAHLFVSKWADHLPYHRQERIFSRAGIEIDRSVIGRAERTCAELSKGVVEAARGFAIAHARVIQTDATGILVQEKEQCRRGHFFVSIADDDFVFFDFAEKHTQQAVEALFSGFEGYLQADASSVYDALFRKQNGPIEVGCMAHARRTSLLGRNDPGLLVRSNPFLDQSSRKDQESRWFVDMVILGRGGSSGCAGVLLRLWWARR